MVKDTYSSRTETNISGNSQTARLQDKAATTRTIKKSLKGIGKMAYFRQKMNPTE